VHFFAIYVVIACLKLALTGIKILVLLLNLWINTHAKGINGLEQKNFFRILVFKCKDQTTYSGSVAIMALRIFQFYSSQNNSCQIIINILFCNFLLFNIDNHYHLYYRNT